MKTVRCPAKFNAEAVEQVTKRGLKNCCFREQGQLIECQYQRKTKTGTVLCVSTC